MTRLSVLDLSPVPQGSTPAHALRNSRNLAQNADSPGSEDHPMVTRYTGAFIDGYEVSDFDEYVLALGPVARDEQGQRVPRAQAVLEGRIPLSGIWP